jgi:hypothetical protein
MDWLKNVATKIGELVDTVVPILVGARTKIAVVACPVLGYLVPFVPAQYQPVVVTVQHFLCGVAIPAFAVAGLVRK